MSKFHWVLPALAAVTLLGAGCGAKKEQSPAPPAPPPVNGAPNVPAAPGVDPLADDLDRAIEDLEAIE